MRKFLLVVPALLAACSTAPAEPVMHGTVPGHICNAAGSERFVDHAATSASGAEVMRATNSAILRWAPPGTMLTMDFSASRVTVHLGPDNKITAINCG